MGKALSFYSALTRLYPTEFRREFGSDLVQHLHDLSQARGPSAAWRRASVDLLVTVPRYRLESAMSTRSSSLTLLLAPAALVAAGALSIIGGIAPIVGAIVLLAGVALLAARSSDIARSLRAPAPDRNLRRRRLLISAACAVVFAASLIGYMVAIGDDEIGGGALVVYNAVGVPAMIGAVTFLIAGLLAPRHHAPTA